jgi:hypothetical protein
MKPAVLISTTPDGQLTRVSAELHDLSGEPGHTLLWRYNFDALAPQPETVGFAGEYVARIARALVARLELQAAKQHQAAAAADQYEPRPSLTSPSRPADGRHAPGAQ